MMDGMNVRMLRDSIKRVEEKRDIFLFGMELGVLCILYLENKFREKMMTMILLEGLCRCPTCVGTKEYFKELETRLNNGISVENNGNLLIPIEGDELKKIPLSNITAHKIINKIDELVDLVYEHHFDGGARRNHFQKCVDIYPQIMANHRQRYNFKDGELVQLQKNVDVWYVTWISITGRDGITNCIYMLGADHIAYYLEKYCNVY